MKAKLVYWHKARVQQRFVLEVKIHKVGVSARYPDGVRYGLILVDTVTGKKILMDNHHPKGHHIHLGDQEIPYDYTSDDRLIEDFKALVLENMGVKL